MLKTLLAVTAIVSSSLTAQAIHTIRVPTDYTYVVTYFDGQDASGLRLAGSDDGYGWDYLPVDFNPSVGDWKIFRDPSFAQGPDGTFHLVWTTGSNGFGYARSTDLLNWSEVQFIKINRGPLAGDPKFCWAPEVIWDEQERRFIVIFSVGMHGREGGGWRSDFKSYFVTTADFETISEPQLLFDPHPPEFFDIDAAIVPFNGQWYAFYKIEDGILETPEKDKDGIHWATAPSPTGPWSGYSAERLPGNVPNSEGPSPIVINGQLHVFYDLTPGLRCAVSGDGMNWTDISEKVQSPRDFRHGTIRKVR